MPNVRRLLPTTVLAWGHRDEWYEWFEWYNIQTAAVFTEIISFFCIQKPLP